MVVQDLITETMLDIGALMQQGQTPNASESTFIFNQLNQMLDEFAMDRLTLYTQLETPLALTSAKQTWTIGVGAGDFNQQRPVRIDRANAIVPLTGIHVPIKILNYAEWNDITERSLTGASLVQSLYCDEAYPIANLNVWPIPSGTNTEIYIWYRATLGQFVTLNDTLSFPPGYLQMLMKSLGVRLRNSFHSPLVDQGYIALATQMREQVRKLNSEVFQNSAMTDMSTPVAGSGPPTSSPQPAPGQSSPDA